MSSGTPRPARLEHALRSLSAIGRGLQLASRALHPHDPHFTHLCNHASDFWHALAGCGPLLRHWPHPEQQLQEWMETTCSALALAPAAAEGGGAPPQQLALPQGAAVLDPDAWAALFAQRALPSPMGRAEVAAAARTLMARWAAATLGASADEIPAAKLAAQSFPNCRACRYQPVPRLAVAAARVLGPLLLAHYYR
jgi:hypothetical protein